MLHASTTFHAYSPNHAKINQNAQEILCKTHAPSFFNEHAHSVARVTIIKFNEYDMQTCILGLHNRCRVHAN